MTESRTTAVDETEVGSYFVANYPPFSVWTAEAVERDALPALVSPAAPVPLGLYLHVPFCRKRCHFCYFRVYTDKNAQEVEEYLDVMAREWELYNTYPAINGRPLNFVYFGGGTPSFLSVRQLTGFVKRMTAVTPWTSAEEITFECEPGTLTESKLAAIRDLGVTRLSLGIENFDDHILELNGRAHRSAEVFRAYQFAQSLGFPQINVDLIAGMLGETEENWQRCVEKTIELDPDSVTIYQMELPYNTTISSDVLKGTGRFQEHVASWETKRRWVDEAFQALQRAGYTVGSAYTAAKNPERTKFIYRDRLWQGADLAGLGVASFGHLNGVHMQNLDKWETYSEKIREGKLPLSRAYRPDSEERLIRELVLQLKLGRVRPPYFAEKYGVDILRRFEEPLTSLTDRRVSRRGEQRNRRSDACGAAARRLAASTILSGQACRSSDIPKRGASVSSNGMLFPLDFVYARSGVALPQVTAIEPDDIPLPYRSLLVHETDMTLTLERHFGGRVVLRPLATFTSGPWYFRRVLLAQEYTGRPVEMGAIRIKVGAFPDRIRKQILKNDVPLGRLLRDGGVKYESRPKTFLAVTPNSEMMGVFWMREPRTLYGRRTEMLHDGVKVGDIVEVLPLV